MMESSRLEEINIIKDVRNLFRLKKETNDTTIKDIKKLLRLKKENEVIEDRILRYITNIFEHRDIINIFRFKTIEYLEILEIFLSMKKKKIIINYQWQVIFGVINIFNIKVKAIEKHYQLKCLNKTRPYLKYITNNLKKSDTENSINNKN